MIKDHDPYNTRAIAAQHPFDMLGSHNHDYTSQEHLAADTVRETQSYG